MIENPDSLFITRRRKKWKFAHFADWSNCFEAEQVAPKHWDEYFPAAQPLTVEVGAGTADLSKGLAEAHPKRNFVALDVKADRLYAGAKYALEHELGNVAFVRAHAAQIGEVFGLGSVRELWITFPDPFPRDRQAKHRLTNATFLQLYKNVLTQNGALRFKTDNRPLFLWSLEQLVAQGWQVTELTFDLHESDAPADYKITTYYERKFLAEGIPINYVACQPPQA